MHDDLKRAVSVHRNVLQLLPASHPDRFMCLNNFANTLCRLFELSGGRDDLEEGVLLHREALELRPSYHPDPSMSLHNLAKALSTWFEQS